MYQFGSTFLKICVPEGLTWFFEVSFCYNCVCMLSCFSHVQLFPNPWTVAHQAPLSMGFSGQEYWSGLPCSPPGDLPHPGIKPWSSALQANSLPYEPPGKPKGRVGPPQLQMEGAWDPWVDCVEQSPDHWSTPDCDVRGGSTFRILSHWDSGVVRYSS